MTDQERMTTRFEERYKTFSNVDYNKFIRDEIDFRTWLERMKDAINDETCTSYWICKEALGEELPPEKAEYIAPRSGILGFSIEDGNPVVLKTREYIAAVMEWYED